MEIIRQKAVSSFLVFPLVSSASNNYYTSAWANLSNASVSAYGFSDSTSATLFSLTNTPTQITSNNGIFSLTVTSADLNYDYVVVELKANEIQTQTLLVLLTSYQIKALADTSNKVIGSTVDNIINSVSVSAYGNFPQVYTSAVGDKTGYSVSTVLDKTNYSISANSDKTGYSVSTVLDKINYTTSSGIITTIINPVSVSANSDKSGYSLSGTKIVLDNLNDINGTSVTATSVTDKSGYSISANSDKSGYSVTTLPQVQVSGINSGLTITNVSIIPNVHVSAIDSGLTISNVSTIPQVQVSGINNGLTIGTVNNITNSVSVSAQTNHPSYPEMAISAIDGSVITIIQSGLATTSNTTNIQTTVNAISAVTNEFSFSGSNVNAYANNSISVDLSPVQTTVNAISAVTNNFTFSGSNVNANAVGIVIPDISATVDTSAIATAILASVIDTKTLADIFTILLSNAVGNVTLVNNVVTYLKQNGIDIAFVNTLTNTTRTQTG